MDKGKFIVFEGGEGSGKTRHSNAIAARLEEGGTQLIRTHEPGGTTIGALIRKAILHENNAPVYPRTELFLFLADRAQHIDEVIKPALDEGTTVLCDRFSGSTFAYQLGGRELPDAEFIKQMDAYARADVEPDLVVYLDLDPAVGLQRKREGNEELNRMDLEELAFHKKVRAYFLKLAEENGNWAVISTEGDKEENEQKIYDEISKLFQ